MRRPRFTIAGPLGIVAFVAVAFAAMREPTDAWDGGVFGVTLMAAVDLGPAGRPPPGGRTGLLAGVRPVRMGLPPGQPDPADRSSAADRKGPVLSRPKVFQDLDGWDLVVANDSAGRETGEILVGTTVYVKADSLANARRLNRSEHLYSLLVGGTTNRCKRDRREFHADRSLAPGHGIRPRRWQPVSEAVLLRTTRT